VLLADARGMALELSVLIFQLLVARPTMPAEVLGLLLARRHPLMIATWTKIIHYNELARYFFGR
jgi:hypothetical protein